MSSIFSKIVSGEIPSHKIAETDKFLAFLDVMPLVQGHTLVIPKKETDYIFDMLDEDFSELWLFTKKVSSAVERAIPCKRIGIAVIGLEVPHAHIHLVPLNKIGDINFTAAKMNPGTRELEEVLAKIRAEL